MVPDRTAILRAAVRDLFLYLLIVGTWVVALDGADLWATLESALVGAVLGAILGGLRTGACIVLRAEPWMARRVTMRQPPGDPIRVGLVMHLAPPLYAGVLAGLGTLIWAQLTGVGMRGVVQTHAILVAVFTASIAMGAVWGWVLRAARLAIAFGVICWAPMLTAFVWVPVVARDSAALLGHALNASPMMGVVAALNRVNVFWHPMFYGRFPYAEYAIHLHGPMVHALVWLTFGAALAAVDLWWVRRRWSR